MSVANYCTCISIVWTCFCWLWRWLYVHYIVQHPIYLPLENLDNNRITICSNSFYERLSVCLWKVYKPAANILKIRKIFVYRFARVFLISFNIKCNKYTCMLNKSGIFGKMNIWQLNIHIIHLVKFSLCFWSNMHVIFNHQYSPIVYFVIVIVIITMFCKGQGWCMPIHVSLQIKSNFIYPRYYLTKTCRLK